MKDLVVLWYCCATQQNTVISVLWRMSTGRKMGEHPEQEGEHGFSTVLSNLAMCPVYTVLITLQCDVTIEKEKTREFPIL